MSHVRKQTVTVLPSHLLTLSPWSQLQAVGEHLGCLKWSLRHWPLGVPARLDLGCPGGVLDSPFVADQGPCESLECDRGLSSMALWQGPCGQAAGMAWGRVCGV